MPYGPSRVSNYPVLPAWLGLRTHWTATIAQAIVGPRRDMPEEADEPMKEEDRW